jgi:hypothetical protein
MPLRTGPSQRTPAERAAIDARAAAWERPISAWQLEALRAMARATLTRGRAGWSSGHLPGKYWQAQTVRTLAARKLCSLVGGSPGRERFARITVKGRRELERHPTRPHAWARP